MANEHALTSDEDDEDLFNLDIAPKSKHSSKHVSSDDIFKEIDDILNDNDEDSKDLTLKSSETANLNDNEEISKEVSLKASDSTIIFSAAEAISPTPIQPSTSRSVSKIAKPTLPTIEEEVEETDIKSKEDSFSFSIPNAVSTPIKPPLTSTDSEAKPDLSTIKEVELDLSILYEDDEFETGFVTVGIDTLAEELDLSILDDSDEDDDTLIASDDKEQGAKEDNEKVEVKPVKVVKPRKKVAKKGVTNYFQMSAQEVKREYYKKALSYWQKSLQAPYEIPPVDHPSFSLPVFHRDSKTGKIKDIERWQEWADKHHPMWARYRAQVLCPEGYVPNKKIAQFIHSRWGWEANIDITRNLTKFSKRSAEQKQAEENSKHKQVGRRTITTVGEVNESEDIDEKDIFKLMLQNVRNDNNGIKQSYESETKIAASSSSGTSNLASCKYCVHFCHCSPGRRLKRPFQPQEKGYTDQFVKNEKRICFDDFSIQNEIRGAFNTQMHNVDVEVRDKCGYFARKASDVMASAREAMEVAMDCQNANALPRNFTRPNVTREQVRELLCVELNQTTYRQIYASPYGTGDSDDEEQVPEPPPQANRPVPNTQRNDNVWSSTLIEDY